MSKRRIAFLIVALVFLAYLAFIRQHASYVLTEDIAYGRAAMRQAQDPYWLLGESEKLAELMAEEEKTQFDVAREFLAEAHGHISSAWDTGEVDHEVVLPILDKAEEADPGNALVNYVRARALLDSPGQSVWKEKALAEVEAGNRKPRFDMYGWRNREVLREKAQTELGLPGLRAVDLAMNEATNTAYLAAVRELARRAAYAAEHHLRAGEPEKALAYARLNFGMAEKLYNNEAGGLIPLFVGQAIEEMARGIAEQAAKELADEEAREEVRRRGLGAQLWFAPLHAKVQAGGLVAPAMALWPLAAIATAFLALFGALYLFFGVFPWLIALIVSAVTKRPVGHSPSVGLAILLAVVGPLAAVLAYVATIVISSATSWFGSLFGAFVEGPGLLRLAFWLAIPSADAGKALLIAAGAYLVVVGILTPLVVRRKLRQQLAWGANLASLYNPFSRGEGSRACRGIFFASLLPAGLVLAGLLIVSFWPVALAMQHAVNVASRGDAPLLEEFGRPPKALDADSYKMEAGRLARQLQSDDDDVVRMATLGLERGLAYERIPELIAALGKHRDEALNQRIWTRLNRLAREVPAKPLEPYLLTREGKLNWHAALVLARSETASAQFMMGKLESDLSGEEIYWGENRTNVFLQKLAVAIREAQETKEIEWFAAALAEGGHRDLAMAVVKRIEATEKGIQGFALRALAYIGTDEARQAFRRYLEKSNFAHGWDLWPSTLDLLDEDLVAWILREHIASGDSIGRNEFELTSFISPRMVPLLLEGLGSGQPSWTRIFCARMLGRVGDESAVPALLQVLAEEPPQPPPTPTATPETDEEFVEDFERMMAPQEHWVVRMNAARALGKIGSPSARSGLESALDDPNEKVRKAARRALDRLPDWSPLRPGQ